MRMRAIHLALQQHLPPGVMREEAPTVDAKYLGTLLQRVALDHPDDYRRVVKKLGDIGRMAAYTQGESMGIDDLRDPIDTRGILSLMDKEIGSIKTDDPEERRQKTEDIWLRYASKLEREAMQAAKLKGNAVADSVVSGARGKPLQLRAMLSTPALFEDSNGRIIPLFARSSYSAGVSPAEMLAGTYGARTSVTATKTSTAKGGFWSKMLAQAAADVVVTEEDCGTTNGIDLQPDDSSLRHRVLARAGAGGALKGGELITRKNLAVLQNKHKGPVLVRSALTCESKRGVCAKCAGAGADGKLPHIGDNVGVTAAQSLGEPVCLHGSTLVRMADGSVKPITEIKVGDMVLGSDMQGRLTPTRVVNTFVNGLRHCYRTIVRKGFGKNSEQIELISTREHKVLSFHGPRKKSPVPSILPIRVPSSKAHRHVVFMSKGCKSFRGRNEPLALMLGLMTGDGSYTGNLTSKGVAFSCYAPELVEYVKAYLEPHRLRLSPQGAGEFRVSAFDQHREFEVINGVRVRNKLKHLLTKEKMWGQSSGNKTVPASIWKWNNASVAAYVGGLIATDGWVTRGKEGGVVGIASNSLMLLTAVKELLEVRFGLFSCRISPKRKKRSDGTYYAPTYELVYCGKDNISIIKKLIKVPGCKQARLNKLAADLPESAKKNGRFAVLSQTYVGHEMTYDIEVDNETHLFALANGLIVSNTQSALNTKHCLLKGTLVRMADYSVRPIELIKVGEQVLGADRHGNTFPVTVTNVWDQGVQEVNTHVFALTSGKQITLTCTAEHEILGYTGSELRKTHAQDMDNPLLAGAPAPALRSQVGGAHLAHCFDISVAHEDELFVLANGLIVSNTSGAAQGRRTYAGLDWLARFVQVPDNFPDRAPLAEVDGVASIEPAPQGGTYVKVGEHTHYVPQHLQVLVKNGEQVEAGTQISDGIVRPDDVVRIKGLGEGRLYYARRLKQMLDDGGTAADPRQAEIVARGAVNHVRLKTADDFKGYLPDDPVRYNDLLDQWEEADDSEDVRPELASGMYLQRPALHYSIGTRLTPSMTKKLKSVGVEKIRVSKAEPPFDNEMMRLQTQAYANPDWLASQQTSYLGRQLSDAARRGQDTNVKSNTHFAPPMAYGVEFGQKLKETGRY